MMGTDPIHDLVTTEKFHFEPKEPGKSQLICARHGLAGIGALTDHGTEKTHGWEEDDYKITHKKSSASRKEDDGCRHDRPNIG